MVVGSPGHHLGDHRIRKDQQHRPEELRGALAEQGVRLTVTARRSFPEGMHGKVTTSQLRCAAFGTRRERRGANPGTARRRVAPSKAHREVLSIRGLLDGSQKSWEWVRDSVGRVGGLAVALGVGAAVFGGVAVAWAEESSDTGGATASAGPSRAASAHAPMRGPARAGGSVSARVSLPHPAATVGSRSRPTAETFGIAPRSGRPTRRYRPTFP